MEHYDCKFNMDKKCAALHVSHCPRHCKFKKTVAEFYSSQNTAAAILKKKGLRPAIKKNGNGLIMSVERDE